MADLVKTLEALTSPNNELRKQAETFYNQAAEANPAQLAQQLFGIFRSNPDQVVRNCAGIFLRRIIIANWAKLDGNTRQQIQQEVRQSLATYSLCRAHPRSLLLVARRRPTQVALSDARRSCPCTGVRLGHG